MYKRQAQGMAETRGSSERIHCWTVDMTNFAAVCAAVQEVCLLYTSDAADERSSVDLGGRRIITKKKHTKLSHTIEH